MFFQHIWGTQRLLLFRELNDSISNLSKISQISSDSGAK